MANQVAYGFVGQEHLFAQRVSDDNIAVVRDAIALSVAEHNRQAQAILTELADETQDFKVRFRQAGSGTLQPLDEWGNPSPVREGAFYDVAFPIQGGGTAWGDNRVTRALMTVEEVNEYTLNALQKDADWIKRHALAAIFDNTTWTYDDPDHGDLTIQPLANGDTVEYLKTNGSAAVDTHYLAQAAAIGDAANPFPTIYSELTEHFENGGAEMVAYVPSNLTTTISALTNFNEVADPDIALGISSDRLAGMTAAGIGNEVLGKVDKVWIVEWGFLPDSYMIAVARGATPALGMRQYPVASLQGFFTEENSSDGNLQEHRFIRYAGFGARNRVGALAYRIGNASYAIPSGYTAPLAV